MTTDTQREAFEREAMEAAKDAAFKEWLPRQNGNVGQESYEPWSDGFQTAWQAALATLPKVTEAELANVVCNVLNDGIESDKIARTLISRFPHIVRSE